VTFKHQRLQQGELGLEAWYHTYDMGDGRGNNYWTNSVVYGNGFSGSLAPANATLWAAPLWTGARPFLLKQYGIAVTSITTGGFSLTIGIYEDSWIPTRDFRYPGTKVHDFQVANVTTTGFKSTTLATPKLLAPGKLYWVAFMKDSVGSCNIGIVGLSRYPILHKCVGWTWPLVFFNGMYIATTYGATLPDPFPANATDDRYWFTAWMREPNQNGT
jgi:hypothetical protein